MDVRPYKVGGLELELAVADNVFEPTTTTNILMNCTDIREGCTVLDMGCGIGVIAIAAAKKGAGEVYAVDIMPEACELARHNAERHEVSDRVHVLQGDLYSPLNGKKFDVIIDDVSGIAEGVARLSPWYPSPVPTGGHDGTGPTIGMLRGAPKHLNEGGCLYFPLASLAKMDSMLTEARKIFGEKLEELVTRKIPFCNELKEKLNELAEWKRQGLIDYDQKGSRYVWYLKVLRATA